MLDISGTPCYYIEALERAYAPVAQLDRVTDYESVGQGFESLLAYQNGNLRVSVLFLFIGTRTSKCGADERRQRRLDGAAHLFSPIPGRKRKRVPSGVPAPETVRFRELFYFLGTRTPYDGFRITEKTCLPHLWGRWPSVARSEGVPVFHRKMGFPEYFLRKYSDSPRPSGTPLINAGGKESLLTSSKSRSICCGSYAINPSKFRLSLRECHRRGSPSPHAQSPAGRWCRRSARRAGRFPDRRGWSSR